MGGAARLLVACTVLRMLAPAAGAAEVDNHEYSSDYWACKNWPDALKRESTRYWELKEAADDDSFVWFCPEVCKSMPYFDIKLTFDFWFRTGESGHGYWNGEWYSRNNGMLTSWKGNRDYRATFAEDLQTNNGNSRLGWPASQVSAIGACRTKRKQENKVEEARTCWPEMPHLSNRFNPPVYTNGVWETTIPVDNCCTGTKAVCTNLGPCLRSTEAPRREDIFITPAYVFYPGSTATDAGGNRECRVVREDGTSTEPSKISTYWTNPPTYRQHSLDWKSLRLQDWGVRPLNKAGEEMSTQGWVDEHVGIDKGDLSTKAENWKKYEWMCRKQNGEWNYYEARNYESKCTDAPCKDFRTAACWQNTYSVAASACAWRTKALSFRADYPNDPDGEWTRMSQMTDAGFASWMLAYGDARYIMHFDRSVMEFDSTYAYWSVPDQPEVVHIYAPSSGEHAFRLKLKPEYSCEQCVYTDQVKGMVAADKTKQHNEVAQCVACHAYERLVQFQCEACDAHRARTWAWASRDSCSDCPASAPMRRVGGRDENCTECQVLDYFNVLDARGCVRLGSVLDGLGVSMRIGGVDQIYAGSAVREVALKAYRAVAPLDNWWTAASEVPCAFTADPVAGARRLSFRRWCGHREIVREQQALLQIDNRSGYHLLKAENTTAGYAAIGDVCGATLRATSGGLFDLQCTDNRSSTLSISVVRGGDPTRCTECTGARYTKGCQPTYHPGLAGEETAYFASGARLSSAGTCAACYSQCVDADHYMSPVELSCMWNGSAQGRVTGALSALPSAALLYWYKLAPCKPCVDATLNTTHAMLVQQCGNKRTYRTWDALQSTLMPSTVRSIPMTRTCCSQHRNAQPCTQSQLEEDTREAWIARECKAASELEDLERVLETYCPPGWYVDEACAQVAPNAWVPDCCKRCDACGPGLFKTETYAACTGATFIDTEQNGCEQSCLSNSYRKDGRCYRCEQCSTTGTGEHL